jgi:cytosine/adenosine deaminase-related metal-dependent hydrolase
VPAAARFTDWIRQVMARRREEPDPGAARILEPMRVALERMRASGVALVGDVSNTLVSVPLRAGAGQPAAVFHELIRFRASEADEVVTEACKRVEALPASPDVRVALAPHAPYSVSPRLFQQLRRDVERRPIARTSVHLAESDEEVEFLAHGTGPWRQLLEQIGAWDPAWHVPGCDPAEYLDVMGVLGPQTLAVHGVQLSRVALERLAERQVTLVTCPRSNRHVGVGDPPVARFYDSGVKVAIGTDSLASAPDLAIWPELARLRALAPAVPASRLLESATRIGAEALGFGDEYGTIEPGKRAALIAVPVPDGTTDVEEWLVSGIDATQVGWAARG